MAIIDPKGLFGGDRLRRVSSDYARLHWPWLFLAADGFGRFEVNYERIRRDVYRSFHEPPTEEEFYGFLKEYRDRHLLFLYEVAGVVWGQWFCKDNCLPRYKTAEDRKSPEPPKEEYDRWLRAYRSEVKPLRKIFENLPKTLQKPSENLRKSFSQGEGVGEGVGVGVGEGERIPTKPVEQPPLARPPAEPKPPGGKLSEHHAGLLRVLEGATGKPVDPGDHLALALLSRAAAHGVHPGALCHWIAHQTARAAARGSPPESVGYFAALLDAELPAYLARRETDGQGYPHEPSWAVAESVRCPKCNGAVTRFADGVVVGCLCRPTARPRGLERAKPVAVPG